MRCHHAILMATAAAGAIATAAPAFAQDAAANAPSTTDAIVVTAQRRTEKVTEVPISITVADNKQLERQQVNTMNDLNRIAPSLEIQSAPGQNTGGGGSIRGIGTQTFNAGAVASVGVVVDQVSQGNANISDLFDVARIEVLKGPQGTLFGLTTSAGVINITTNKPDFNAFSARFRTEDSGPGVAGSVSGNQIFQSVVNLPLAPAAAIRVSAFANLRQGPDRDITTGKYDDSDTWGTRAHLLWEPSSRLTINAIGDYSHSTVANGGDFFTFVKTGGASINPVILGAIGQSVPDNVTALLATCGVTAYEGNQNYCMKQQFSDRFINTGGSLQLDYKFAPFTVTSITAYRHGSEKGDGAATNVFRADPLELQVQNAPVNRPIDLFTEELRVTSPGNQFIEYTVGAFYSHQIQHRDTETVTIYLQPVPGFEFPVAAEPTDAFRVLDESAAVFGQTTIHATQKLRLIAGLRFTDETLRLDMPADAATGGAAMSADLHTHRLSWKGGAQYDITHKTMAYATVSQGYKGGQIATPTGANPYVIQPEIPTSYELGLKSTLLGSWVLDTNLFYEKIKNFQAQSCTVSTLGVISCVQDNINGVKSRGGEIDLFGKVTHDLTLNTGFIFAKATYPKGYLGTDGSDIGGTQLAYAPKFKFTASGEYTHEINTDYKGFLGLDTVWKSRIRYEANSIADTTFRPHWMVGGRLGIKTADERFTAAIFARNLFNVHEPELMQSSLPYSGASNVGAIYGQQSFRTVGISLDGKF